jgi:phosphate transport system substrate-binding protein
MLPLAKEAGQRYAGASLQEVSSGVYPFASDLVLYVNREPGKPIAPFIKEFARLILSREGQAIIAGRKDSVGGYLPLTASEVSRELIKLNP